MMSEASNPKRYDLEERTALFARNVRSFARQFPKSYLTADDVEQLLRASGSVGANYIEANESISKKDFVFRLKICRKEAKESKYWLDLLNANGNSDIETERTKLMQEATELTNIFGAIIRKSE